MMTDYLASLGYRVLEADSLRRALAVAAEEGDAIDLAIADVVLDDGNGVEVARHLREAQPTLPVIFVSGLTDGMESPTENTFFLRKPFTLEALASVTRHALDHGSL